MRIEQLACFEAVARHLSYTRAADELHITQPNASQQVHALEKELGFPLLKWNGANVALTEAGKAYYAEAAKVLETLVQAQVRGREIDEGSFGTLTVGVFGSSQSEDLLPLMAFKKRHPQVRLFFQRASSDLSTRQMLEGKYDLCFMRIDPYLDDRLEAHGKRTDRCYLIVHSTDPHASQGSITRAELASYRLIFASPDRSFTVPSAQPHDAAMSELSENIIFAEDQDMAWFLMRMGFGAQVVPKSVLHFVQSDLRALEIVEPPYEATLAWVCSKENGNPTLGLFLAELDKRS